MMERRKEGKDGRNERLKGWRGKMKIKTLNNDITLSYKI
jgi:hypothetical protein